MAIESATYIDTLDPTNPTATDPLKQGDDHLRMLKSVLKDSFPEISGPMTATQDELNILDGATLSTDELNHVQGVTSPIQTQLDELVATEAANTDAYTAEDVLAKLVTVDGHESGVDADLLDGQEGAYYSPAPLNETNFATQSQTQPPTQYAVDQRIQTMRGNQGGNAPVYAVRAWVNFNESSIHDAGNVSSVVAHGGARYTVKFATPLPNQHYAVAGSTRTTASLHQNPSVSIRQSYGPTVNECYLSTGTSGGDSSPSIQIGSSRTSVVFLG